MRLQGVEGILYKDRKKRELARLVKIEMMGYDCARLGSCLHEPT